MIHFSLLRLVSPRGGSVAAGAAIGLALSALAIAQAFVTAALFTTILSGKGASALAPLIAALAALLLARPVITAARELIAHAVASRMKRDLRGRVLDHDAARGPFADPGSSAARIGERHALLVDGVESLEPYVTRYLPQVMVTFVTAAVTVAILCIIDPVVGAVAGATALTVPLIPRIWDRALSRHGTEHWGAYASLHADVADSLRGMETLKLLGAEHRRRQELAGASTSLLGATLGHLRLSLVESGLTGLLLLAGPALALAVGVARVASGDLHPTSLFAVTLISAQVFLPFRDLANHWHAGYLGVTAGSQLLEHLRAADARATKPVDEERDNASGTLPESSDTAVEITDLQVRYPGADSPALQDLSVTIPRASLVAIVGPSGSGKSTIANAILGLLPPERGRLATIGTADAPPVSLVSQDPVIFAGTLRDNLAAVAPTATDEHMFQVLRAAGAGELAERRGGLGAELGDSGSLLSGGQRQRVAIARALLRRSPILLLDEATSALDAKREREILGELRAATRDSADLTVIVITHRLAAIREADRIVVVRDGTVAETGTYAQLAAAGADFARLHAAQMQEVRA